MRSENTSQDATELQARYRKRKKSLLQRLGWNAESPLLWGVSANTGVDCQNMRENHVMLSKKLNASNAQNFLTSSANLSGVLESGEILRLLQVAYSIDDLSRALSSEDFHKLIQQMLTAFEHFESMDFENVWQRQAARVELPFVLAVQAIRSLAEEPAELDAMIDDLVDGDGWIVSNHVRDFVPLLASWARCVRLLEEMGMSLDDHVSLKLEWMARQWLRAMRPDGTAMLGAREQEPVSKSMQSAVLNLSTDREDKKLARLRTGLEKKKDKDEASAKLHDGGGFSEWAGVGVFQCGWKADSPRVAIAIEDTGLRMEVANRTTLLSGLWDAQINVNGVPIQFDLEEYELNCYHSDEEVEFLELEYTSESGVTWQRQILLARDEQFLLLGDAVLLDKPARIDFRSTLPFEKGVESLLETDNREIYLVGSKILSLVLPLALGEWKSDRMPGNFGASDGRLVLEQSTEGSAIYCPLFFDLSPRRCTSPRTWRSLTVAEELKILDRDKAVAFRVQVGEQQWVIYRSLSGIANRTFLGENQICEFFVGRTDGDVAAEELIQIE